MMSTQDKKAPSQQPFCYRLGRKLLSRDCISEWLLVSTRALRGMRHLSRRWDSAARVADLGEGLADFLWALWAFPSPPTQGLAPVASAAVAWCTWVVPSQQMLNFELCAQFFFLKYCFVGFPCKNFLTAFSFQEESFGRLHKRR